VNHTQLKALPGAEELAPSVHHRLLVLFESGLHLALIKTRKPHGKRLRRFLAEEVMPQLVRNGTLFDGSTDVPLPNALDGAEDADRRALPVFSLAQRREARLAHQADIRDRCVEFCDRRFRVQTIHRLIDRYQGTFVLPATEAAVLEFTAAALAVEEDIFHIVAPDDDWKTVTQLAAERGVSPGVIQQIIVDAELRGDPTYSRRVARSVQLPGVSKVQSVLSWTYNQAAAAIIDDVLEVTPSLRAETAPWEGEHLEIRTLT
jgi:hypothetical protein